MVKNKYMSFSEKWKHRVSVVDVKRCLPCEEKHGKIYGIEEFVFDAPPDHLFCRCKIERMQAMLAGNATKNGVDGADWYLKYYGILPDYYISYEDAKKAGWNPKLGNLYLKCPDKMIANGIYRNENKHLPSQPGRIWYEADIDYESGRRGTERIVYSNDGLIFVTYDHYHTFIEIK
ncbi:MAG: phage head morphogenesis protein [Clostridia bacterium]|nr:phage head morphogenesis protein [Clostridia bacterium]